MAKAIKPAIRPYSIAVAPDLSRRNFRSIHFTPELWSRYCTQKLLDRQPKA
jgi:hypothetical protein